MTVLTSIDQCQSTMQQIQELQNERNILVAAFNKAIKKKRPALQKEIEAKLTIINKKIKPLQDSIYYVSLKTWIEVSKTYLTKSNIEEIDKRVTEVLLHPELMQ